MALQLRGTSPAVAEAVIVGQLLQEITLHRLYVGGNQ